MADSVALNVGNRIYLFANDAYNKFTIYLDSLRDFFRYEENYQKAMQEIELIIADQFDKEFNFKSDHIVTSLLVDKIIQQYGYGRQWQTNLKNHVTMGKLDSDVIKRLNRNMYNKIIAGVCSGLADYFKTKAIFIRLLFVLLFIMGSGISLFAYIILWIVVPKNTESGYSINSDEILNEVKESGKSAGKLMTRILGIFILFIGLANIFAISIAFIALNFVDTFYFDKYLFLESLFFDYYLVIFYLIFAIPFIMLFMLGLRLLRLRPFPKYTWSITWVLWGVLVLSTVGKLLDIHSNFSESFSKNQHYYHANTDRLYLITDYDNSDKRLHGLKVQVIVLPSPNDSIRYTLHYFSNGATVEEAQKNVETMSLNFSQRNDSLFLSKHIDINRNDFRGQEANLTLYIPENFSLVIRNFSRELIRTPMNRNTEISLPLFQSHLIIRRLKDGFQFED